MQKKSVMAQDEVISHHVPRGTDKNHTNPVTYLVSEPKSEIRTSHYVAGILLTHE